MSIRKRKMVSGEAGEGRCGKWVQQSATRPEGGAIDAAVSSEELRSQYFSTTDKDGLRLGQEFFNQPCVCLAKAFLGKVLVRRCADGTELRARVVETEAYLGGDDKASHSAGGKRTERNTAMFMKPGTIYVYQIYGIYLCMNVSSQGEGAAVLLRSLEPLQGQAAMRERRAARRREGARPLKDTELCNGPSKLCQALDVPRSFDRRDLAADAEVWLESDSEEGAQDRPLEVVSAPRVGIESSGEWAARPLRFYLRGHPCVSVVNREAERRTPPQGHQRGEQGGREDDTATAQRWDISSAGVEQ